MAPDSRPRQTDHDLIRDWIAKPGTDRPPVDEILPSAFRLALEVLAAEFAARPAQAPSCPAVARDHVESACDEVRDRLVTALGYKLRILAMRSHGETTPALSDGRIDAALSDTASQVLLFSLVASCGEVVATPLAEFLLDRVAWCLARGIRKGFDDLEDDRRSCWVRCCAESIRGVRKFEYRTLLEALSYFRRVCLRGTRGCETPPPPHQETYDDHLSIPLSNWRDHRLDSSGESPPAAQDGAVRVFVFVRHRATRRSWDAVAASLRQGCGGVAAEDLRGEVECAEVERAFVEILGRLEAAKVTQSVGLQDDCVRGGHTLFMPGSFLIFLGALTGLDTEGGRKAAIRYWIYSLLQDVLGRSWEEIVECRGRPHCGLESHDFPPGCRAEDIECAFSGRENNANANRRHQASLRTAVRAYRLKARG